MTICVALAPRLRQRYSMDHPHLLYDKDGAILTLTLNRPEALNAISPDLEQALHIALDEADADPEIHPFIRSRLGRSRDRMHQRSLFRDWEVRLRG